HLKPGLGQSVGEVETVVADVVVRAEMRPTLGGSGDGGVLVGGGAGGVDRDRQQSQPAGFQQPEQLPHRGAVVRNMLQHVVGQHEIEGGARQFRAGDVDLMGDAGLEQIGGLVQRIAAHPPHERFLRREMQDSLAGELVAAALGDPQMQQPVPLPGAAVQAARIPAARVANTDERAAVAADWATARQPPAAELPAVPQPRRGEAPRSGQLVQGAGKLAAQWRAMSNRRVTQTPAWLWMWSSRRCSPAARAGWPMMRMCRPMESIFGWVAPSRYRKSNASRQ